MSRNIHPQELLAQTLNQLAGRSGVSKGDVDDVVIGCVSQAGEQGGDIARMAVLAADWPLEVTGAPIYSHDAMTQSERFSVFAVDFYFAGQNILTRLPIIRTFGSVTVLLVLFWRETSSVP